jgi:cell shape-determining protein MreC
MFGIWKKTMLITAGYIIWGLVATLFSEKKWEKVREDLKKVEGNNKKTKEIILNNFINTHQNLLESFKEQVLTEENKKLILKEIEKDTKIIKDYKKQGEHLLEELKEKGITYVDTAKTELEKLYEEKKLHFKDFQNHAPEQIEEIKEKLISKFNEVKEKIKK